ncbi:MAG: hypothetical protein AB1758_08850 [Candidatus Eremiobacterota bacterium]
MMRTLCLCLMLTGAVVAGGLLFKETDVPGTRLIHQDSLGPFWPQVENLPEPLRTPESAPQSAELLAKVVLSGFKLEGHRWVFSGQAGQVTVDSGTYPSAVRALDGLLYLVYEGAAPKFHPSYYPFQVAASERPVLTAVSLGDRGYRVAWPVSKVTLVYFVVGPHIFMVDSSSVDLEVGAARAAVARASELLGR